jgi:hypothetical protein
MTPDGREVDFRCHHNHRTKSAAVTCADTIRKQINRGQSLHMVTRVRSTPASREATRQRALQKETERQAKDAQRARAARQRTEQQQARRESKAAEHAEVALRRQSAAQQRAEQKRTRALQRQRYSAEQHEWRTQAALKQAELREQAAQERTEQRTGSLQRNGERLDGVHRRPSERARQRGPRGWPISGLVISCAVVLIGVILASIAGKNSHGALSATAGAFITLGMLAVLICGSAALWRRFRKGKRDQPDPRISDSQNIHAAPYLEPASTRSTNFASSEHLSHTAAGYLPDTTPPVRTSAAPPWET